MTFLSEVKKCGSQPNPLPSRKSPLDFIVLFYVRSGCKGKHIIQQILIANCG